MDESVGEVIEVISEIKDDGSVPKNIKQILNEIKDSFENSESELKLTVDAAMQKLEELAINPNVPSHTRTQIWNMTSVLEDLNTKD